MFFNLNQLREKTEVERKEVETVLIPMLCAQTEIKVELL